MNKLLAALVILLTPACSIHVYETTGSGMYAYGYAPAYRYQPAYGSNASYVDPNYYFVASGCTNLNPNVCTARNHQ